MSGLGIRIPCRKCGLKVPVKEMKYALNGKNLLCESCNNKQHQKLPLTSNSINKEAHKIKPKILEKRIFDKYFCNYCKYRFSIRRNSEYKKRCPYCGKDDQLYEDKPRTAEDLIKEVSELEEDKKG